MYVIHRKDDELIPKLHTAQSLDPSHGDWVLQVRKHKKDIGLNISEEEIRSMSKDRFKSIVKQKIEKLGIEYLEKVKNSHSKTEFLNLKKFSPQEYLLSELFENKGSSFCDY